MCTYRYVICLLSACTYRYVITDPAQAGSGGQPLTHTHIFDVEPVVFEDIRVRYNTVRVSSYIKSYVSYKFYSFTMFNMILILMLISLEEMV